METIVYRDGYPCKWEERGWKVRIWEAGGVVQAPGLKRAVARSGGSGQREVKVQPRRVLVRLTDEPQWFDCADSDGRELEIDVDLDELAERAARQRVRNAQRAKETCRHKVKQAGFSTMLTGTYRENMADFNRLRRDFAGFLRIMRRVVPGFRCVFSFEPQKRGAWHWHMATDRLPRTMQFQGAKVKSYAVATAVWRQVVGVDNGMVHVDQHLRTRAGSPGKYRPEASLARMAGYLAKYLTKDHGSGIFGRNRWGSTQGIDVPAWVTLEFDEAVPMIDVIAAAWECPEGHRVARHWLSSDKRTWVLYTEPEGPSG